jgi:hypothetical protein
MHSIIPSIQRRLWMRVRNSWAARQRECKLLNTTSAATKQQLEAAVCQPTEWHVMCVCECAVTLPTQPNAWLNDL